MKVVGDRVQRLLREWGLFENRYADSRPAHHFRGAAIKRSPHLDTLSIEDLRK